jgi:hypothetical protein
LLDYIADLEYAFGTHEGRFKHWKYAKIGIKVACVSWQWQVAPNGWLGKLEPVSMTLRRNLL